MRRVHDPDAPIVSGRVDNLEYCSEVFGFSALGPRRGWLPEGTVLVALVIPSEVEESLNVNNSFIHETF
jgi:hypothetical protein